MFLFLNFSEYLLNVGNGDHKIKFKKYKKVLFYFLELFKTLSLLSSLLTQFILGNEPPFAVTLAFRLLLNLAISSPKTSPVLKAEIKSSNSP